MVEYIQILIFCLSAGLWALGGTCWKPFRRIILPICLVYLCYLAGIELWKVGITSLILFASATLPYGDGRTWLERFLVGCTFALSTLPIGITVWQLVTPIVFFVTFWFSKHLPESKSFTWKICELLTGAMVGTMFCALI